MQSLCVRSMSEVIELLLRESTADLETSHPVHPQERDGCNDGATLGGDATTPLAAPDLQ